MTIEQRIERLERLARRWRTACCVCVIVVLAALFIGADDQDPFSNLKEERQRSEFDVIRCRGIELVDGVKDLKLTLNGDNGEIFCRQMSVCNAKNLVRARISGDGIIRTMGWSVDDVNGESIAYLRSEENDATTLRVGRNRDPFKIVIASQRKGGFVSVHCLDETYALVGAGQAGGIISVDNADGSGAMLSPGGVRTGIKTVREPSHPTTQE